MSTDTSPAAMASQLYPDAAAQEAQAAAVSGVTPPAAPTAEAAPAQPTTPPAEAAPAEPAPAAEAKPEGEAPPADPTTPEARKPDDYTFDNFPENFQPDEALLGKFREMAAKANLDPALAKDLSGLYVEALQAAETARQAIATQEQTTWRNEIMAMPEFAPGESERTTTMIARTIEEFGTPELTDFMNKSGVGNQPALVKFILNLSSALMEGEPTPPGGVTKQPQAKARQPTSLGSAIYGDSPHMQNQ
jgi:hypothetical protein